MHKLLIKKIHKQKANLLLPELLKECKKKKIIVAIGGNPGTGKTEVATILQKLLETKHKIKCQIISMDDYYINHWQDRTAIRKKKGIKSIGKQEIDWKKIGWEVSCWSKRIHIKFVILEGLYACYYKKANLIIFLEGEICDTYKFRKERKKENPDDKFRIKVLEKEAIDVKKSKQYADIIVSWDGEIE